LALYVRSRAETPNQGDTANRARLVLPLSVATSNQPS